MTAATLKAFEVLSDKYTVSDFLGEGTYGSVVSYEIFWPFIKLNHNVVGQG